MDVMDDHGWKFLEQRVILGKLRILLLTDGTC